MFIRICLLIGLTGLLPLAAMDGKVHSPQSPLPLLSFPEDQEDDSLSDPTFDGIYLYMDVEGRYTVGGSYHVYLDLERGETYLWDLDGANVLAEVAPGSKAHQALRQIRYQGAMDLAILEDLDLSRVDVPEDAEFFTNARASLARFLEETKGLAQESSDTRGRATSPWSSGRSRGQPTATRPGRSVSTAARISSAAAVMPASSKSLSNAFFSAVHSWLRRPPAATNRATGPRATARTDCTSMPRS